MVLNRFEAIDTTIVDVVSSKPSYYDKNGSLIPLDFQCMRIVGFIGDEITFSTAYSDDYNASGDDCIPMTFSNKKGYFTVQEMIDNIVVFEKEDRPKTRWFGAVVFQISYQGIYLNDDGTYGVNWGSVSTF